MPEGKILSMSAKKLFLCILVTVLGLSIAGCTKMPDENKTDSTLPVENISGVEDLKGKKIGVSLGSGADMRLTGNDAYEILRYDTATDALLGLQSGSVSAIAAEITTAREFMKENNTLSVLGGDIGSETYGVALPKGSVELKNKVDLFIHYLKDSGAYGNMVSRWIKSGTDSIKMPDIKTGNGPSLHVGINAEYAPFEYIGEKEEMLGFDIEFIKRFAAFYNFQLEFYESDFSSLFLALDEGKVDMIISAVAITEEREQRYTFSDAYYNNEIVFLTNSPLDTGKVDSLKDLDGKSIGLLTDIAKEHANDEIAEIKNSQTLYFEDLESELMALRAKRISALLAAKEDAQKIVDENRDLIMLDSPVSIEENIYYIVASGEVMEQRLALVERVKNSFYNNLIKEQRYLLVLEGLWITIQISLASGLLGTLLGLLFCYFIRSKHRALRSFAQVYTKVIQGTPIVVLLLIVCYVIFARVPISENLIAIITFSVYFSAHVCELLATGIHSVGSGQKEAAMALGYTETHAFFRHILPQAVTNALPAYRAAFVSLVQTTSIVGYIAISDLTKASDIIRSRTYEAFFPLIMVAIIYFVLAYLMTLGLKYLERRMDITRRKRSIRL